MSFQPVLTKNIYGPVKVIQCIVQKCNLVFSNIIIICFLNPLKNLHCLCHLLFCGNAAPSFPNLRGREHLTCFLPSLSGWLTMCLLQCWPLTDVSLNCYNTFSCVCTINCQLNWPDSHWEAYKWLLELTVKGFQVRFFP